MAKQDASTSPLAMYRQYCERGELAYQVCTDDGSVVFFPRLTAPGTASPNLEWQISKGLGTVYATTTLHRRGEDPYDVSMVELDEGFRMMSRVESIDPMEVKIGMRVKVRMIPATDEEPSYPVFDPAEG